jgi:hypothetical protein
LWKEIRPDGIFLFINDEIMSAISYYGRRIKEIERELDYLKA